MNTTTKLFLPLWQFFVAVFVYYLMLEGLKKLGLVREDLYQVVTYMHTMSVNQGGFIFPSRNTNENDKNVFCYELAGDGGFIRSIKILIPYKIDNQSDFYAFMAVEEARLKELIINFSIND